MATASPHTRSFEASDEAEAFDRELCELVRDTAPRFFAVVQKYALDTGEWDGEVAAWGIAYDDGHAEVITTDRTQRMSVGSAERAATWFGRRPGMTARVVWLDPVATPKHDHTAAA